MRYLVLSIIGVISLATIFLFNIHLQGSNNIINVKQNDQNLLVIPEILPVANVSGNSLLFASGTLTINGETVPIYTPLASYLDLGTISPGSPLYPSSVNLFGEQGPNLNFNANQLGTNVFGTVAYSFITGSTYDAFVNPYSSIIAYAPNSGNLEVYAYSILSTYNNTVTSPLNSLVPVLVDGLGNNYTYYAQNAIVRPIVPPKYLTVTHMIYKFGVVNLFVSGISSSSPLSQLLSNDNKATSSFNSYFGINPGYSPTTSFSIPFVAYPYLASQQITNQYPITNYVLNPTFSPLFFVPQNSNTWTNDIVYTPYVIPLYEVYGALPPSTVYVYQNGTYKATYNGNTPYEINMPVMIVANGKIILLSTAITGVDPMTGYFLSQEYPGQQIGWFAGPGVQCSVAEFNNSQVQQLSPYSEVFYLSSTGYITSNSGSGISYTVPEQIFVVDPYNQVAYLFNIVLNVTSPSSTITGPAACEINVQKTGTSISVTKYNLQGVISLQNMNNVYIDTEYANQGMILFYEMNNLGTVTVYELNLNTGQITTYTQQIPISGTIVQYAYPALEGATGQLLSYVSVLNGTYYITTLRPTFIQGSIPTLNSTQLPNNYTFAYSYGVLPITIYYNGSQSTSNVVVILNITSPQILSAIATPTAQDIRIFMNNTYGTDYYAYPGLEYSILQYTPGSLLSVVVLLPYINPGNNTIYMYMGYPYAQSVMVPANSLLNQYSVLKNG
ncbi:MAG: hypothetical protein ACP5GJ_03815 [Nanopusillaceae archaeon]